MRINLNKKGFTLLEMLVTLIIFSVFITMVSSLFTGILKTQKRVSSFLELNDNLSLVLEQLAREVRNGNAFDVKLDGAELDFKNKDDQDVIYKIDAASGQGRVEREVGGVKDFLTSNKVNILYLKFIKSTDSVPLIKVLIGGKSASQVLSGVEVNLQTSITAL